MLKPIKRKRLEAARARKNFFPTLVITLMLWTMLGAIILFIDPETSYAMIIFFVNLLFALSFTFSIILVNTRRGFLLGTSLTAAAALRYLGVDSVINFILLFALVIVFEYHFMRKT